MQNRPDYANPVAQVQGGQSQAAMNAYYDTYVGIKENRNESA